MRTARQQATRIMTHEAANADLTLEMSKSREYTYRTDKSVTSFPALAGRLMEVLIGMGLATPEEHLSRTPYVQRDSST